MTVRTCAVDGGTLTADTEIVRLSHCGAFYLDERCSDVMIMMFRSLMIMMLRYIYGCIDVCDDVDGCNEAQNQVLNTFFLCSVFIMMTTL